MNKISIVILNYNRWDLVHQLLMDIYQKCTLPLLEEVLVVNNGCTQDESFTGLNWWINRKLLPIRELRLEENLHFIGGFNAGLKAAKGDILVALSNDVRIYKDLTSIIVAGLSIENKMLIGGRMIDWNTGWNTFDGRIFPYLEGWLLATTKDDWKDLDYFDIRYSPNDMEDVDLSTTAFSKGYALAQITPDAGTVIQHLGAQTYTYSPEREAITIQNKEKFRQKWITKKVSPS